MRRNGFANTPFADLRRKLDTAKTDKFCVENDLGSGHLGRVFILVRIDFLILGQLNPGGLLWPGSPDKRR